MTRIVDIIQVVSFATGVDVVDICSDRQSANYVRPRHIAMYLAKACTPHTLTEIGHAFAGKEHSTVLHAIDKIQKQMETDATLKSLVKSLEASIAYRATLNALGKIDVLSVARSIALHPQRGVIGASVGELAALASTTLDLWEVASCAEALALSIQAIDLPEPHDAELPRLRAFASAIIDEMNHIAGPAPAAEERTEQ